MLIARRHSRSRCMQCEQPPVADVQWANGRARAWFCAECFVNWLEEDEREPSRAFLVDGEVPKKFAGRRNPIWISSDHLHSTEELLSAFFKYSHKDAVIPPIKTRVDLPKPKEERADLKLFVNLAFPNVDELVRIQEEMDGHLAEAFYVPQKPEHMHLTLLYGENVPDKLLPKILSKIDLPKVLTLTFESLGTFEEAPSRPIIIHIKPDEEIMKVNRQLFEAASDLGIELSEFSSPDKFKPHITLGMELEKGFDIPKIKLNGGIISDTIRFSRDDYQNIYSISLKSLFKPILLNI